MRADAFVFGREAIGECHFERLKQVICRSNQASAFGRSCPPSLSRS